MSTGARTLNGNTSEANFDTNMVIILAALLCALVCALGINSIVRCILRCANRLTSDAADETPHRVGLKKRALRQIPVAEYRSSGNDNDSKFTDCPICLGEFLDGEKVRVLPNCHHCFHVKCIDIWLASRSSCPTCRQSLVEQQPVEAGDADVEAGVRQVGNGSGGNGDLASSGEELC